VRSDSKTARLIHMARLRSNGTELLRTAKEVTIADPGGHL